MQIGVHIRSWDIFPGPELEPIKIFRVRIHAKDAEPKSEPEHFARDQIRSRLDVLLRAGVPAAADTFPDSGVGV